MQTQSIDSMKGEVRFRKKLAAQHVTGETLLPDYYAKDEHDRILLERIETTVRDMRQIAPQFAMSPFIELGAERCQRSLVLTNDFNAVGFAVDISLDQLRTASHFAEKFGRPVLPYRVCCDANNLPIRNESVPFAFCYEFLHHFPTPKPVVREIHRVLSGGVFVFREEPFRRPRLVLFHQRHKLYSTETLRKSKVRRFLESFLSEELCDEREYGIIENDDIPLQEWIDSLAVFENREVFIQSLGGKIRTQLPERIGLKNLPNMLFGGGIGGNCMKPGNGSPQHGSDLTDLLLCPDCRLKDPQPYQPSLQRRASALLCQICGASFPLVDGVTVLLPTHLRRQLYPEINQA